MNEMNRAIYDEATTSSTLDTLKHTFAHHFSPPTPTMIDTVQSNGKEAFDIQRVMFDGKLRYFHLPPDLSSFLPIPYLESSSARRKTSASIPQVSIDGKHDQRYRFLWLQPRRRQAHDPRNPHTCTSSSESYSHSSHAVSTSKITALTGCQTAASRPDSRQPGCRYPLWRRRRSGTCSSGYRARPFRSSSSAPRELRPDPTHQLLRTFIQVRRRFAFHVGRIREQDFFLCTNPQKNRLNEIE